MTRQFEMLTRVPNAQIPVVAFRIEQYSNKVLAGDSGPNHMPALLSPHITSGELLMKNIESSGVPLANSTPTPKAGSPILIPAFFSNLHTTPGIMVTLLAPDEKEPIIVIRLKM